MKQKVLFSRIVGAALLCGLTLIAFPVSAQQLRSVTGESRLRGLYSQQIRLKKPSAALEQQIATERERIRALFDDEVGRLVEALSKSPEGEAPGGVGAYERQRSLVTALQARLDEVKVDSDLLGEEERTIYKNSPLARSTGPLEEGRITESYPELLAKRAVLEESARAIESAASLQQDRLQKLGSRQRFEKLSTVAWSLRYLLIVLIIVALERFVRLRFFVQIVDRNRRYFLMKLFTAVTYLAMTAWILATLFDEYPGVATSFAIVGAGIAVSLQDLVRDFVGWLIILQKGMFTLGERVTIGDMTGDVIDIGPLRLTLLEVGNSAHPDDVFRTGQALYIPNSVVLKEAVMNYHRTSDFVEAEMKLTVTHESDWKAAEQILSSLLHEETDTFTERAKRQSQSRTLHFYSAHEEQGARVFMDIGTDGITFTLRFLVPIGGRKSVTTKLTRKILEAFKAHAPKIEMAYVTRRVIEE